MSKSLIVVVLCLCSITALGQVIHYEQNFDGLKEGDLAGQDGWETGPPANQASTQVTSAVKHGPTGKSMEVNANQEVIRNFDPIIKKGIHFLSIWFRFENPGVADNTLHIYMGEVIREWRAGPVIRIGAQSTDPNKVGVHDGNTVKPVGDIKKGEWQHIFEVIDVDKQTYTVYLDDEVIAENFSWRNPANHHGLGWLMLGFDLGSGLIGYFDDIVFGEGDKLPSLSVEPGEKLATTWAHLKKLR
jgi:hypothetical protein